MSWYEPGVSADPIAIDAFANYEDAAFENVVVIRATSIILVDDSGDKPIILVSGLPNDDKLKGFIAQAVAVAVTSTGGGKTGIANSNGEIFDQVVNPGPFAAEHVSCTVETSDFQAIEDMAESFRDRDY